MDQTPSASSGSMSSSFRGFGPDMKQQRLLRTLIAVGAVVRAPASSIHCVPDKARGLAIWVIDFRKAPAAAEDPSSGDGASGEANGNNRRQVNHRATRLAGRVVTGDAVVTLLNAVDDVEDHWHLRPIRLRREFLRRRKQAFPPTTPQQVDAIRRWSFVHQVSQPLSCVRACVCVCR